MVVATSDTEILIAQGIVPGCCYRSNAYLYNTQSKQYKDVGPVPNADSRGLWLFDCTLPRGSLLLICIGGTNEWAWQTNRY